MPTIEFETWNTLKEMNENIKRLADTISGIEYYLRKLYAYVELYQKKGEPKKET